MEVYCFWLVCLSVFCLSVCALVFAMRHDSYKVSGELLSALNMLQSGVLSISVSISSSAAQPTYCTWFLSSCLGAF